jgi:hypothetical protein
MTNDIAVTNRQGMVLSNFMRTRYGCEKRIGDLTFGDIIEICEFLNIFVKEKNDTFHQNHGNAKIIENVKDFIAKNINKFHDFSERNLEELLQMIGYIKHANGKTYYCIFQEIFEREVTSNRDEMQILVNEKILIPRINGDFYHSQNLSNCDCNVYIIEDKK